MTENLARYVHQKAAVLERAGIDQARAEIEMILCYLRKCDRLHLYLDGMEFVTDEIQSAIDSIIDRRKTRYPLQYILGESWFYGRRFAVTPDVMVPTPETEFLCETAIAFAKDALSYPARILDLGTGSGVISVTLACELENCQVVAVDISEAALSVAKENARSHQVDKRIEFRKSNFFEVLSDTEKFDLILSNPPYITENDYKTLPPEVLADPKLALVSGADGLDAIRMIIGNAPGYLAEGGRIMFEIGYDQGAAVRGIAEPDQRYRSVSILQDLNDCDRLAVMKCGDG